jgi:hypothetical protein
VSDYDLEAALGELDALAPHKASTSTDQARRWVLEAEDVQQLKAAARAASVQVASTNPADLFELGALVEARGTRTAHRSASG